MSVYKRSLLVFLLLVTLGTAGTLYGVYAGDKAEVLDSGEKTTAPVTAEKITVYVTGAVNKPGLATLTADSRVADAVNFCGGVSPTADAEGINMAQILKDGQHIKVPEKVEKVTSSDGNNAIAADAKQNADNVKVNINTADSKTLETLPGIGPAMAKRIIDYRNEEGAFAAPEDLKKIRGIGEAKFAKLKDLITL